VSNLKNGHRERAVKRAFRARCQAAGSACWICRQPIDYAAKPQTPESFEPDHHHPVKTHPHLAYEPTNLRPSHCRCNRSRRDDPPPTAMWVRADWGGAA
jgi:hypothetical protein